MLRGLQTKDDPSSKSGCPLTLAARYVKARCSSRPRQEISHQPQKPPQTCGRFRGGDAAFDPEARHSRRSMFSCTKQPPPKLKRDTDVTEHFVSLLILFATRLITAIWPLSACPPMMSTCFNGAGVLPLRVFIQETLRRSKTSYSTLQVALYYLILLKAKLPSGDFAKEQPRAQVDGEPSERSQCRAMQCGRRMFLSALMLASKYLQDRNYSARAWSKISGLRSNEINENEREYLFLIDYDLHVPKESFDNWSRIVLSMSKLSKERPLCRSGTSNVDSCRPGSGSSNSLADMVSQVDLDEHAGQDMFTDEWWTGLIQKLDPRIVRDADKVDDFLRRNLPEDKMDMIPLLNLNRQMSKPWDSPPSESVSQVYDMNFSETLKPRNTETTKVQTPQTPVQMSPTRNSGVPMRPHLGNLPTPQTTPRISDKCQWSGNQPKPFLRCSASMDAMSNMRRQCIVNANLERCPPPRPQGYALPSVKSLLRPAETIQELPSRSTTPLTSSPASVVSDTTASTTPSISRSRSSSISSNSSWSSVASTMPRLQTRVGGEFSSPLARVCSLSDRYCKPVSTDVQRSEPKFHDEGYGSGEEPQTKISHPSLSSTSEVDAIQVLMSLSARSEPPSQCVTPTPHRRTDQGDLWMPNVKDSPRGHKRTLSKTDHDLQTQVGDLLREKPVSLDDVSDDATPKQWQLPTKNWATPRRALPKPLDNKRVATYCSMLQFSSVPDLQSQYLQDSMITAS